MSSLNNSRVEKIDFYKGVLMFGVVWGHMITNLLAGDDNNIGIHVIVRTYDMPMFMLLSGYFLTFSIQNRNWLTLVKDRSIRIIVPTVLWGTIISPSNPLCALYFLYAIFVSTIIVGTIGKLVKSRNMQILIFFLISVILNLVPMTLWNLSYLFPFFALGYIVSLYKLSYKNWMGGGIFSLGVSSMLLES